MAGVLLFADTFEIEQSLQNGETDGVEKAVAFINEKAESVDLKAIENSAAALAGGKNEGYNGSGTSFDDAINKNWYGDEAYHVAVGAEETKGSDINVIHYRRYPYSSRHK